MNVRYRVELSQTERAELTALLERRQARGAQAQARADFAGRRCRGQRRGDCEQRGSGRLDRLPDQAPLRGRQSGGGAERRAASRRGPQAFGQGGSPAGGDRLFQTRPRAAPAGRWSLLAGAMVKLTEHDSLSRETVRRRLAENDLKPWRKDMWCIPQVDGEYVARMEDVLDLYAEAPDPKRPVVCFDESPTQLIGEVRQPIPAKPGQLERYDCEYQRNGTANLFVFLDVHRPWRKVKVTDRRAAEDLRPLHARSRRCPLIPTPSASGSCSGQSVDPLSGRPLPSLPARRSPAHACAAWSSTTLPKHASWLNMVEIEIGVLRSQCLDRRIDNHRATCIRNRRLGAAAQCLPRPHQMDVHNRQSPRQNGPRLP